MNQNLSKRILKGVLAFGLFASVLPTPVMAAQEVSSTPGGANLSVEYFNSTFYNWDEAKANAATAKVDMGGEVKYSSISLRYSEIAPGKGNDYTPTNYWRKEDNSYYPVYYKKLYSYIYVFYYKDNNDIYQEFARGYNGNQSLTVYEQNGDYEGKGFYFTASGNRPDKVPGFSKWVGAEQNYMVYSGLAASNLKDSKNQPFSDAVNAANLFAVDGSNSEYTEVYTNVKVPYIYDEGTGYYTLNSDTNAVYFKDGKGENNATMQIADKPAYYKGYSGDTETKVTGFAPFNNVNNSSGSAFTAGRLDKLQEIFPNQVQAYGINASDQANYTNGMKYGFGMVTSVNFQMTDDGKDAKGNDITFEFAGDDDVWVYVDDVLVLDIGGTHDAISGSINFKTGNVTLHSAEGYDSIGDLATNQTFTNEQGLSQTNLYTALDTNLTGFASKGTHTLKIYYMDRGQGRTNCMIKFNLPQRDTVSVTKKITQSKNDEGEKSNLTEKEQASVNNRDYDFVLYENEKPMANKTYYLYAEDGSVESLTTNSSGHFSLKNNQTATFLVDISETGKTYSVKEEEIANFKDPEYTYQSSIGDIEIVKGQNGFTGMTVSASGSATAADSVSFVCENFLDAELPNPGAALAEDTYVIDYGLPLEIKNVMDNDVIRGDSAELVAVKEQGDAKYGKIKFNETGRVTYTLTKPLDQVVTLKYTVKVTGKGHSGDEVLEETKDFDSYIYIIPATTMYYEEDFSGLINYHEGTLQWQEVSDGKDYETYQEQGKVGDPSDSPYGSDKVYLNNIGDSYGTSMRVTTDTKYAAKFDYTFSGSGTTIYSRISPDSAYIRVAVKNVETEQYPDVVFIDTRVIGSVGAEDVLYNVPVYSNNELEHGTYNVEVTVYKKDTPVQGYYDENNQFVSGSDKSGSEFYLDGVSIYKPLVNDEKAETAYASDGENNATVMNVHSKIVADSDVGLSADDFFTLTDISGEIMRLDQYGNIGPNNEFYLNAGIYNVSFYLLNWDSTKYHIYLGMKALGDEPVTVKVGEKTFIINNNTDCYFDVSECISVGKLEPENPDSLNLGTLTIGEANGLVSLTSLKVTGTDEFDIGYAGDYEQSNIDSQTLYLLPYNYPFEKDEDQNPGVSETFKPEKLEVNAKYAKLTKKTTVKVVTSTDVAYIKINDRKFEPQQLGSSFAFSNTYSKADKDAVYQIVAYDKNGIASETYTVVAE